MGQLSDIDWGLGEVDFDYLMSLVEQELRSSTTTDFLIDRFLEQTDLRIEVESDVVPYENDIPQSPSFDLSNGAVVSEELARIYHSQGLYSEAKDIYTKLFLLYSEKIAYFASQIEALSNIEGGKGDVGGSK
ncbi:MAG: hypothetical protein SNF68_01230 [Rikenellaceae bacterium]